MNKTVRRIFLDLESSIIAIALVAALSVIGALLIYFDPEFYWQLSVKPLFGWLFLNLGIGTSWLVAAIVICAFLTITSAVCIWKDISHGRLVTGVIHGSFVLILFAHLISAVYSFKVPDNAIPQKRDWFIPLPPPGQTMKLVIDNIDYKVVMGQMANISAKIRYLDQGQVRRGVLAANNPLRIGNDYIVLKGVDSFLDFVEVKLNSSKGMRVISMRLDRPTEFAEGVRIQLLAANPTNDAFKVIVEENGEKQAHIISIGNRIVIRGVEYTIEKAMPSTSTAVIADVSHEPSVVLVFWASTVFTALLTYQAVIRLLRRRGERYKANSEEVSV